MTYTNRKNTPLKYHRFVEFFLLPLSMIFNGGISYLMISGFLKLRTPGSAAWRSVFRMYSGINLSSPGGSWIYVAWITGIFVLLFVLDAECWNGMRLWRRKGMILWLLKNTVLTVLTAGGAIVCLDSLRSMMSLDLFLPMIVQQYGIAQADLLSSLRIMQIVLWAAVLISTVILVLNYVYYLKRRMLFRRFYADPLEEPLYAGQTEAPVRPVPAVKRTAKLLYCPQCGKKLADPDINYCTECGAKLKEE